MLNVIAGTSLITPHFLSLVWGAGKETLTICGVTLGGLCGIFSLISDLAASTGPPQFPSTQCTSR